MRCDHTIAKTVSKSMYGNNGVLKYWDTWGCNGAEFQFVKLKALSSFLIKTIVRLQNHKSDAIGCVLTLLQ
jgi:hypothetical protein